MPLLDSAVLLALDGRRDLFGRQRVWGTLA